MKRLQRNECLSLAMVAFLALFGFALVEVVRAEETPPFDTPRAVTVPEVIDQAAERHGVSASLLRCVAWKESTWRPWVTSPANHRGLFQFSDATWWEQAPLAGWAGASPYDAEAASDVAAQLFSKGESWRWPTARRCA